MDRASGVDSIIRRKNITIGLCASLYRGSILVPTSAEHLRRNVLVIRVFLTV